MRGDGILLEMFEEEEARRLGVPGIYFNSEPPSPERIREICREIEEAIGRIRRGEEDGDDGDDDR